MASVLQSPSVDPLDDHVLPSLLAWIIVFLLLSTIELPSSDLFSSLPFPPTSQRALLDHTVASAPFRCQSVRPPSTGEPYHHNSPLRSLVDRRDVGRTIPSSRAIYIKSATSYPHIRYASL